jgi:hypothetical protein
VREKLDLHFARKYNISSKVSTPSRAGALAVRALLVVAVTGIAYATVRIAIMLTGLSRIEVTSIVYGAGATFLRVEITLILAAMWTIPVGSSAADSADRRVRSRDRVVPSHSPCFD